MFCNFISEDTNSVYQDEQIYMFEDKFKKAEFHYLIIPKVHMRDSNHILTYEHMNLVEHMIQQAKTYVHETLKRDPNSEMQLHFHKPMFTSVKHLHMHVLVGNLSMAGKVFFCNCMSNDPIKFTKKMF